MEQRISLVTLGVADVDASRAFYERLGWTPHTIVPGDVTFFQAGGMVLGLWGADQLAADCGLAAPAPAGAIALAYNVGSPAEVDALVAEAEAAGATIQRPGAPTEWGGYSGCFLDPDGHPWEVAHNPFWTLAGDGSIRLGSG